MRRGWRSKTSRYQNEVENAAPRNNLCPQVSLYCSNVTTLLNTYLQERKIDLKENLLIELEDKKKNIENERLTMELTGGRLLPNNQTSFVILR